MMNANNPYQKREEIAEAIRTSSVYPINAETRKLLDEYKKKGSKQ